MNPKSSNIVHVPAQDIFSLDFLIKVWYNLKHMTKKNLHYVIWKEGKYFVTRSLEVEVASQGKTRNEAIHNLQEALDLYFEDQQDVNTAKIESPRVESLSFSPNA